MIALRNILGRIYFYGSALFGLIFLGFLAVILPILFVSLIVFTYSLDPARFFLLAVCFLALMLMALVSASLVKLPVHRTPSTAYSFFTRRRDVVPLICIPFIALAYNAFMTWNISSEIVDATYWLELWSPVVELIGHIFPTGKVVIDGRLEEQVTRNAPVVSHAKTAAFLSGIFITLWLVRPTIRRTIERQLTLRMGIVLLIPLFAVFGLFGTVFLLYAAGIEPLAIPGTDDRIINSPVSTWLLSWFGTVFFLPLAAGFMLGFWPVFWATMFIRFRRAWHRRRPF